MEATEHTNVLNAIAGDRDAYGALVDTYKGLVFAVALNITGNYTDSEDIVQEAFLQAYRKLGMLNDPAKFASWLYTIARRAALDFLKKQRRITIATAEIDRIASDAATPAEVYAKKQLSKLLWSQVAELPPKTREAMLLFYMEGFSIRRSAEFLEIGEEAMKSRLQFGRERLRESLMGLVEGELHNHRPTDKMRQTIMAALPAVAGATSAKAAASAALAVSVKAKVAIVAIVVLTAFVGSSVLITRGPKPPAPGGGIGPAPIVQVEGGEEKSEGTEIDVAGGETESKEIAAAATSTLASPTAEPTPQQPQGETASVSGRVVGENGYALAKVGVYRIHDLGMKNASFDDLSPKLLANTKENGTYTIEDLEPGIYRLTAHAEGYALPVLLDDCPVIELEAGDERGGVDFRLAKPHSISGRVFDQAHAPLAGASVRVATLKLPEGYRMVIPFRTKTDAGGDYILKDLREGEYHLAAAMDGYSEDSKMEIAAGSKNVDFVLGAESGVSGWVTIKATGEPVQGVEVTAQGGTTSRGSIYSKAKVTRKNGSAKTDENGFYLIRGLNAARYPVRVDPYEHEGQTLVAAQRKIEIPAGKILENVDFALAGSSSISGRVFEKGTDKPIASAKVVSTHSRLETTSGADGSYRLADLKPQRHFLRVEAEGYVMKYILGYNEQGACCATQIHKQIDVLPQDEMNGVDFEMTPETVINGRVVDPDGIPLVNATIHFLNDSGLYFNHQWKIQTDATGSYAIRQVNVGNYYVKATLEDYVTGRSDILRIETAGETVQMPDIVLHRQGAAIMGKIATTGGDPIGDARIQIVQIYDRWYRGALRNGSPFANYHIVSQARSDADGNYLAGMIGRGPVEIQVEAAGYELVTRRIEVDNLAMQYEEDFVLGGVGTITGIGSRSRLS